MPEIRKKKPVLVLLVLLVLLYYYLLRFKHCIHSHFRPWGIITKSVNSVNSVSLHQSINQACHQSCLPIYIAIYSLCTTKIKRIRDTRKPPSGFVWHAPVTTSYLSKVCDFKWSYTSAAQCASFTLSSCICHHTMTLYSRTKIRWVREWGNRPDEMGQMAVDGIRPHDTLHYQTFRQQ